MVAEYADAVFPTRFKEILMSTTQEQEQAVINAITAEMFIVPSFRQLDELPEGWSYREVWLSTMDGEGIEVTRITAPSGHQWDF